MSDIGQKIIAKIREIAAGDPDFVYQSPEGWACVYVHGGEPSCIVGRALWALDLISAHIEPDMTNISTRGETICHPNTARVTILIGHLGLPLDDAEVGWLSRVQSAQDSMVPWGEAVAGADEEYSASM